MMLIIKVIGTDVFAHRVSFANTEKGGTFACLKNQVMIIPTEII